MKTSVKAIIGLAMVLYLVDAATVSQSYNLTSADIQFVLDQHNQFRSAVANGKVGTQPSASDMLAMTWDPALAAYAQSNTDKCDFTHSSKQLAGYSSSLGENMAAGQLMAPITGADWQLHLAENFKPKTDPDGSDTWIDEQNSYTYGPNNPAAGHYKQLVWDKSNKVGCAITQCNGLDSQFWPQPDDQLTYLISCNYYPPGNMGMMKNGARYEPPPYQSGSPCSACPTTAKTCNPLGLCSA